MELENIAENKHEELMALINPLVDFMIKNEYNIFMVAGKDNICTRHLRGQYDDVTGMITGMMQTQKQVAVIMQDAVTNFRQHEDPY